MRVLAIGAHPDDVELLCGGTLAKYAREGHDVSILIATRGDAGSATLSRDEIAEVRRGEAQASADLIGATLDILDFDDELLFDNRESRLAFIEAIRQARPDVMFVHDPEDYHPDHRAAGKLAIDSRIPSTVRLVSTASSPLDSVPHVFLMDRVGITGFEPDALVDISAVLDTKNAMLRCHASQDPWMQAVYGVDYVQFADHHARARGQLAGVSHAEAFRSLVQFPVTGDARMLP